MPCHAMLVITPRQPNITTRKYRQTKRLKIGIETLVCQTKGVKAGAAAQKGRAKPKIRHN
jgi:hypothetical protein